MFLSTCIPLRSPVIWGHCCLDYLNRMHAYLLRFCGEPGPLHCTPTPIETVRMLITSWSPLDLTFAFPELPMSCFLYFCVPIAFLCSFTPSGHCLYLLNPPKYYSYIAVTDNQIFLMIFSNREKLRVQQGTSINWIFLNIVLKIHLIFPGQREISFWLCLPFFLAQCPHLFGFLFIFLIFNFGHATQHVGS